MDPILTRKQSRGKFKKVVPCNQNVGTINFLFCLLKQACKLFILVLIIPINCKIKAESRQNQHDLSSSLLYDYYMDRFSQFMDETTNLQDGLKGEEPTETITSSFATPPLRLSRIARHQNIANLDRSIFATENISPDRVYRSGNYPYRPDNGDLYSPLANLRSIDPGIIISQSNNEIDQYVNDAQSSKEASNLLDLIDPGSGNLDNQPIDQDNINLLEDSITHPHTDDGSDSTRITPTPTLSNEPHTEGFNRAPILNRRLPRLAVIAGQVWRYFIPSDTFIDEDGDMRKLKSYISRKLMSTRSKLNLIDVGSDEDDFYYSWIQYDPNSQLLYGFPTEDDVGQYDVILVVSDQYGAISEINIEVHVRRHQSSRAFTHQFLINNISWDKRKFPSMVDTLGELIRLISNRVFMDKVFENLIVQYYRINGEAKNLTTNQGLRSEPTFNLAIANSSLPIHPCSIGQIEDLFRYLADTRTDWKIGSGARTNIPVSHNLKKVLEPDFLPDTISLNLQGSCDSNDYSTNNNILEQDNNRSTPIVRVKIGKLSWKLGEPIEYRIPVETFESDQGSYTTRDLHLYLHTIDGNALDKDPKYNFLDFDQESQMIFGLPFNQEEHSGQRELLLSANHPKSGSRVREVFIINIEPQDLTTINNRAFQMSLYFYARTRIFGPREEVALSHKIIAATRNGDDTRSYRIQDNPEITIIDVSMFLSRSPSVATSTELQDRIFVQASKSEPWSDVNMIDTRDSKSTIYKYTWTNESIGYWGDCPVEVIKENILYALEQSMLNLRISSSAVDMDDVAKNDSTRFFERLRHYFEPESDLIHLRFEPLGACINAMELHDVGYSDLADMIDRAGNSQNDLIYEITTPASISPAVNQKPDVEPGTEEYWSIVVLLVLVVVLIFVIIMFFMGMHTYKINQDKRFELQVKLTQARQNSMYLSSMILSNLATPNDCGSLLAPNGTRCSVRDEDRNSRKPVILDNEKQLLTNAQAVAPNGFRSTAVQIDGQSVRTTPIKKNSILTLDSIAGVNWNQPVVGINMSPSTYLYSAMDGMQRTMTLNRKSSVQRMMPAQSLSMNHSQSILTVASIGGPLPVIPQNSIPIVYTPVVPVPNDSSVPYNNYSSLKRCLGNSNNNNFHGMIAPVNTEFLPDHQKNREQFNNVSNQRHVFPPVVQIDSTVGQEVMNKFKSSSRSSSATTNSVISNPNYVPTN